MNFTNAIENKTSIHSTSSIQFFGVLQRFNGNFQVD